ncbi:hypothetical protein PSP6_1190001 [Paraburkholderia tropica]|nr:hypothetical protein PSP6_1190001 [Paraburkholderia tropica]
MRLLKQLLTGLETISVAVVRVLSLGLTDKRLKFGYHDQQFAAARFLSDRQHGVVFVACLPLRACSALKS